MRAEAMSKIEKAQTILQDYWGTSGPDSVLRRKDLRNLRLGRKDLVDLFDELPPPGGVGTTHDRVSECYRFLESL